MSVFELKYQYRKAKIKFRRFCRITFVWLCRLRGVYIYGMERQDQRAMIDGKLIAYEVETRIKGDRIEIDKLNKRFYPGPQFNNHISELHLKIGNGYLFKIDDFSLSVKYVNSITKKSYPYETGIVTLIFKAKPNDQI